MGNWPGVTVEKKEGKLKKHKHVTVVDLPGIYSLSPYTLEEVIARDYIIKEKPDVIINIVDTSNLERNLYLTTQLIELGVPVVVALNMMDIVQKRGDKVDTQYLEKQLGCPVVGISAVKNEGFSALLTKALSQKAKPKTLRFSNDIESALEKIKKIVEGVPALKGFERRWASIKLLERDKELMEKTNFSLDVLDRLEEVRTALETAHDDDTESIMTNERYESIAALLKNAFTKQARPRFSVSDKIDKILTNRILALPIFFLIMWGVYYVSIQTVGDWTIGWVEELIGWISGGVETLLVAWSASGWLISLIIDGILGGIGAVLVFVPQLMILYFFISLLEDCGYMARVAFIMDRIFRRFGLSGKSFIPMLIGTGCSVPAIMASRTI